MNLLKKIIKSFKLIKQGISLKDKAIIFLYFLNQKHTLFGNVTVKSNDGIFFCGDKIESVYVGSDLHEREIRPYFDIDKGNFIDVGANLGKFSIVVAKRLGKNGKVFAIEPHPENYDMIKKNVILNKLNNIEAINVACSSKEGYLDLYVDKNGTGGHTLKRNINSGGETIKVKSILLDNYNIDNVKLIKLDVEGSEADVLKGAKKILKRDHPKIIFEAWDEKYLNGIKKVLIPFKYQIKRIGEINYLAF